MGYRLRSAKYTLESRQKQVYNNNMENKLKWYKLDTSAKIYPAIESIRNPSNFRVSAVLKQPINPNILIEALENVRGRFPYYFVHLKRGLFWSYLEENKAKKIIWKDTQSPCSRIRPSFNNGYLFKVRYFNRRISLDVFHVLTDGYGGMEFLKCLLAEYLWLKGEIKSIDTDFIMDKNEQPQKEECEDAFLNVLESKKDMLPEEKKRSLLGKKSYFKLNDRQISVGKYKVVTGIVSISDLKKISKAHNATITQLIASLYLEALIHLQAIQVKDIKKHKNVSVQIPVNMRNFYPNKCMRNFSLFVIPFVDPRNMKNLDDIIVEVKKFMAEHVTEEHLLTMIEDNCSIAQNFVIRHVPRFFKDYVIRFMNNTTGSTQFSGTLSNLGAVKLPEEMKDKVDYFDFILGPSSHEKCACSVASYKDKAAITFGRTIKSAFIPEYIFAKLVDMGAAVEIKSNY